MNLKNLFFAMLPMAALMASCSSDEPGNDVQGGKPTFEGDGWVAVRINLPSTSDSRANDKFDDGEESEYAVNNAALVLFKGATENSSTFVGAYALSDYTTTPDVSDDPDDNISVSILKTQKIQNVNLGNSDKLYALVMVNYTGILNLNNDDDPMTASIGETSMTDATKFSDVQAMTTNVSFYTQTGDGAATNIFMTNSPLSDKPGGASDPSGANITTLVNLTNGLWPTEAEAKAHPAGSIYVERAVAKATLSVAQDADKVERLTIADGGIKWALANVESNSYVVRNLGDKSYIAYATTKSLSNNSYKYRFVGADKMGSIPGHFDEDLYRPYWCIDPNYSENKEYSGMVGEFASPDKPLYCNENTFDLAHQTFENTTRAVIEVTFNEGKPFYVLNEDNLNIFKDAESAESHPIKAVVESAQMEKAFQDAANAGKEIKDIDQYLKFSFARNDKGVHAMTDIAIAGVETGEDKDFKSVPNISEIKDELISLANTKFRILEYADGKSYYDVRFKHFGDDQTPWSESDATPNGGAYSGNAQNWLGRWGMVRNNWYDLTITAFKNLGEPVIPDADVTTTDDNVNTEKWVTFRINILSWAKRTQNVEF
ncbi:MAG: fimbria major subunit [Muribaculum sp.]|nr:fimbria major subunit [Muribaculum sp.]